MLFQKWYKNINPDTEFIAQNVKYYKTVDSTNNVACDDGCQNGTLFIAEKQTNGKGRMGRKWISKKGDSILMSLALIPQIRAERINLITLVTGISVCEALNKIYNIPFKIKWPNDIVIDGKKICGILTEGKNTRIIIGIGINANQNSFTEDISHIATSLYMLTGKKSDRAKIVNVFAEIFENHYVSLLKGDTDGIIEKYKKLCVNMDMDIIAVKNNNKIQGKAIDISKTGELIIKKEDGTTLNINSGEVSVRGMYGYI